MKTPKRETKLNDKPTADTLPPDPARRLFHTFRVLVADDHAVVRRGIRSVLEAQPGIEVCGEASTGAEAMEQIRAGKPDLVILDLTMPEMNGLDVLRAAKQESPSSEILILTMHFSEELAREVLRSGAIGYVLKSDADSELLAAVDHARHHQPFFTGELAISMARNFIDRTNGPDGNAEAGRINLTQRELEILQLLAIGKSNKEVAAELRVSPRTIESHRNRIMKRMNFQTYSDLVRFAVRENLVEA